MDGEFDLRGRRVLVTGASAGIGACLAVAFAQRGAVVGICARRTELLSEVLAQMGGESAGHRAWTVDLSDLSGIDAFAADVVAGLGDLDVLVNNAGIPKRRWAWDLTPQVVTDVMAVNYLSPVHLTLALLPTLLGSDGRIVNVSSVAARLSPPAESAYSASKAALTAFSEGLAVDLAVAGHAARVHVVNPAVIETDLFHLPDNDATLADVEPLPVSAMVEPILAQLASGRFEIYVPDDFAAIATIKASDTDGFLQGSAAYAVERLRALGREL